jgi:hypothetical protein
MKKLDWKPTTVDECMRAFGELLSPVEQMEVTLMSKDELIQCHHGLGRWVRNNWGLWEGGALLDHMKSLGFIHPDDISMSLIREWWARMNKVPSIMSDEIKRYAEYWEKNK